MLSILGAPTATDLQEDNPHFTVPARLEAFAPILPCTESAGFDCRDKYPTQSWRWCDAHLGPFTHMATYTDGYYKADYFRHPDSSWSLGAN